MSEKTGAFVVTFYKTRSEGISEGVNLLFDYIAKNSGKRTKDISMAINVLGKTIERWMKELRENNKIQFIGSSKTGGYYII